MTRNNIIYYKLLDNVDPSNIIIAIITYIHAICVHIYIVKNDCIINNVVQAKLKDFDGLRKV